MREAPRPSGGAQDWCHIHLLKGLTRGRPCVTTHNTIGPQAVRPSRLHCLKKTHAGRGQGAKHAEFGSVSDTQIRRAGRWNTDAMTICYLSSIPREFVRRARVSTQQDEGIILSSRNGRPPRVFATIPLALDRCVGCVV